MGKKSVLNRVKVYGWSTVDKPIKWLLSGRQDSHKKCHIDLEVSPKLTYRFISLPGLRFHSQFMERIINFIAVAAHVSLMPELASWTRMHMLEHVTISMICISPYAAYKSVSIFISRYFYDTIDLLLPVFLCSASIRFCSCDLCGRHSFIAPSCPAHRRPRQWPSQHRICGHNNKYMSNILPLVSLQQVEAKATPTVFVCTYICLHLAW